MKTRPLMVRFADHELAAVRECARLASKPTSTWLRDVALAVAGPGCRRCAQLDAAAARMAEALSSERQITAGITRADLARIAEAFCQQRAGEATEPPELKG